MRGDVEVPGYTLHEIAGRGGFAVVHRATQESVDREVAVKLIDTAGLGETALRRFRAETRAVGSLSWHPHVVSVYDAGTLPGDVAFLVMDYLPDGTFGDRAKREGGLPVADAVAATRQLCDALQVAHDASIVHRDVKPENLMIGRRGDAQLADFGIATLADTTRSATGTFIGTVAFSAPELLKGGRADVRSDIFSVGATLHALLAGRSPFIGDDDETAAAVMWRVMAEEPAPLPATVPEGVRALVARCLAKEPAARPATAAEVMAELDALAGGPPAPIPTPPPTGTTVAAAAPPAAPAPPPPAAAAPPPGERRFPPPPTWTVDGPPVPPPPAAPAPVSPTTPAPPATPGPAERTMVDGRPAPIPSSTRGRRSVLAAVGLVVVLVAAAAVFALGRGGDDRADAGATDPSTSTTPTTEAEEESTTTTEEPATTTTPTEQERARAVPRGHFAGESAVRECTGWTAGDDCSSFLLRSLDISCVGSCTASVFGASVPLALVGTTYRGEVAGADVGTVCEGVPTKATITIDLDVGEAIYSFDQWRAETISGQARVTQEASACTAATALVGFDLTEGY